MGVGKQGVGKSQRIRARPDNSLKRRPLCCGGSGGNMSGGGVPLADQYNSGFDDGQVEEFKQAFYAFDADGEGTIGREELDQLLDALGENLTETEVDKMVAQVDKDGSGEIDFDEFLYMMRCKLDNEDNEKDIQDAFNLLDKDGSGFIEAHELKHIVTDFCGKLTDVHVDQLLKENDLDGDGTLSYPEFKRLMTFSSLGGEDGTEYE